MIPEPFETVGSYSSSPAMNGSAVKNILETSVLGEIRTDEFQVPYNSAYHGAL